LLNLEEFVKLLAERINTSKVREIYERVKGVAESIGCEAHLIGSWAEGRATPASDIDILVTCRDLPKSMLERGKLKAEILEKAGIPDYEDVHIELVEEKNKWYYLHTKHLLPTNDYS